MNIEQLEFQMDSVLHSLRQRFRRASASSPSSSVGQSPPMAPDSLLSSAAPSPISRREMGGRRSSLRSRGSLRKLRQKLFGETASGESSQRGEGADESLTLASEENLAWTAPVSPQIEARSNSNNPRRRNSVRLRELQRLLRAYHEQRELWMQPTERSNSPKKQRGSQQGESEPNYPATGMESPRMIPSSSPPIPLHYSRGLGHHPLPPFPLGRPEPLKAPKRMSLSQLELELRGNANSDPEQAPNDGWPPSNSSSPLSGQKSSLSPSSPQSLPPKPKRQLRVSISPPAKSREEDELKREEQRRSRYFRVESPRPIEHDVHQKEEKVKEKKVAKKPKEKLAKESKRATSPPKEERANMFSPAGLQQLLFSKHRQRRQSEGREVAGGKHPLEGFHTPAANHRRLLVKPAISEPRLSRSAFSAFRPDSIGSSLAALSLSPSITALEHLERLRDRITETKYVTAAFESRGGLGPVLDDVKKELEHWLGAGSKLLAVACEVHWSVPERFRSRQLEIQLKECLHAVLRENNRRILGLNNAEEDGFGPRGNDRRPSWANRITPFPITLAKSRTEESCTRDLEEDAFQGIYRRFYPALLSLQDPATVQAHKGYWTLENLADGRRSPPVPRPARFLYQPLPNQLTRKSLVALNMAVLRLRGDNRDYDAEEEQRGKREGKEKTAKRRSLKQSFF